MAQLKSYRYAVVDVFTTEPLAGNPLAVFPDASEFDETTMQKIARELNMAETAFVVHKQHAKIRWIESLTESNALLEQGNCLARFPQTLPPRGQKKERCPAIWKFRHHALDVRAIPRRCPVRQARLSFPLVVQGRETRRPASTTGTQVVARSCRYFSQNFPF
jgi:hypothetical protein